jgi:hypothetical protein
MDKPNPPGHTSLEEKRGGGHFLAGGRRLHAMAKRIKVIQEREG